MDVILIWVAIAITAAAALMMVGFGAKNAATSLRGQGKLALAAFALPIVIFAVVFLANAGSETQLEMAFIMTAVILIASGLLALLISGVRSLVK